MFDLDGGLIEARCALVDPGGDAFDGVGTVDGNRGASREVLGGAGEVLLMGTINCASSAM